MRRNNLASALLSSYPSNVYLGTSNFVVIFRTAFQFFHGVWWLFFYFFLCSISLFSCQKRHVDVLYTEGFQAWLTTAPRAYKCLFTSPIAQYPSRSPCSDSVCFTPLNYSQRTGSNVRCLMTFIKSHVVSTSSLVEFSTKFVRPGHRTRVHLTSILKVNDTSSFIFLLLQ